MSVVKRSYGTCHALDELKISFSWKFYSLFYLILLCILRNILTLSRVSMRRYVGPHFTVIYVERSGLPLVGAKCITEQAHASYK